MLIAIYAIAKIICWYWIANILIDQCSIAFSHKIFVFINMVTYYLKFVFAIVWSDSLMLCANMGTWECEDRHKGLLKEHGDKLGPSTLLSDFKKCQTMNKETSCRPLNHYEFRGRNLNFDHSQFMFWWISIGFSYFSA